MAVADGRAGCKGEFQNNRVGPRTGPKRGQATLLPSSRVQKVACRLFFLLFFPLATVCAAIRLALAPELLKTLYGRCETIHKPSPNFLASLAIFAAQYFESVSTCALMKV